MAELTTARLAFEKLCSMVPSENHEAKEYYRIGDLAREFDVSLRTLRFYEDRGLLHPKRSGSTRLYSRKDRQRLRVILLIKSLGFSLVDIEEMLQLYDGNETEAGLNTILEKFAAQLSALQTQKAEIEKSISDIQNATQQIKDFS